MTRPCSGRGPVCHQCVTVPDHCQVPGCTRDLTQPWEPEGCGWAQGADSSPEAQGVPAGGPSPAETTSQSHSSTALLWHSSLEAGGGFVSDGHPVLWGPGGSLAHPACAGPSSATSSCAVPPWCLMASADMGTMAPPVSATCPQGCLAGQHGCHCRAVGTPSVIPVSNMWCRPSVTARVSPGTEAVRPPFSLPFAPRSQAQLAFLPGLGGMEPSLPQHPAESSAPLGIPRSHSTRCARHRDPEAGGTKDTSELIPPARAGKIIALCSLQEAQRPLVPF